MSVFVLADRKILDSLFYSIFLKGKYSLTKEMNLDSRNLILANKSMIFCLLFFTGTSTFLTARPSRGPKMSINTCTFGRVRLNLDVLYPNSCDFFQL